MEEIAVVVIALELDIERSGEVERLGGSDEPGLDVVGLLGHGQGIDIIGILVLDLLLVVGDKGLFLDIAVVVHGTHRRRAVSDSAHDE